MTPKITKEMRDALSRSHSPLQSLIEEGIRSGDYQAADKVFTELRQYVGVLASHEQPMECATLSS